MKPTVYYMEIPKEFVGFTWSAEYVVAKSDVPEWSEGTEFDSEDMELAPGIEFVLLKD